MDTTIRIIALFVLSLVEEVFVVSRVQVCGGKQAMLAVMQTGRSPTMRHLSRTHRVSVAWLYEQHQRENFASSYVPSNDMAADIVTKSISQPDGWVHARKKINVFGGLLELTDHILCQRQKQHMKHDPFVSCAYVASSALPAGETPRLSAEPFVRPTAPAMEIRGRTPTSTIARAHTIIRQVLEPQQVGPQAVSVPRFSEIATPMHQLCQRYDLCPLVDLQELSRVVEASG